MKIAICFFGITRSLKYTIHSIKEKVFDVFDSKCIEYDTYVHTYSLNTYANKRTNEHISDYSKIDNLEYTLLNPTIYKIDDQDVIKCMLKLNLYRTHTDPFHNNYDTVNNFILAQYSKNCLVQMVSTSNIIYDYVLFMRPDCLYVDTLDTSYFNLIQDTSVVIPNFHLYGPYRINDRFAITNMNTYKIYGNVFTKLFEYSKTHILHPETIIGLHLKNIDILRVKFNFNRVRCDGRVLNELQLYEKRTKRLKRSSKRKLKRKYKK